MAAVTVLVILIALSYPFALFVVSRRRRAAPLPQRDDLTFVFVIPCLNEALVIGAALDHLLTLPGFAAHILVVDDGSDDGTGDVVRDYASRGVWLLERRLPAARQGKGRALNAAFEHLRESDLLRGRPHDHVIVAVIDADGRVAPNILSEVAPYFSDPRAAAVQVGVRMTNAHRGLLARLQDLEFVTFTEVFQRARQRVGSVGLGGNGQFVRLTALESLGDEPWSDCLTEDLDLGIRLLVRGWHNSYCPTTHVSQQAVTSVRRLVRQRSRWFQGHLQCWSRVPLILRSDLGIPATADLVYHVTSPVLMLLVSLPILAVSLTLGWIFVTSPETVVVAQFGGGLDALAVWYIVSFGVAPLYGFVYWLDGRDLGLVKSVALAHVFTVYSYVWLPAGWAAVVRVLRRRRNWAKTARTRES